MVDHSISWQRLTLQSRPARVATLVPIDDRWTGDIERGWLSRILRMIENYSYIWGGAGNALIPWRKGQELPTEWLNGIAAFDPDWLGRYHTTMRGWRYADPHLYQEWEDRAARDWMEDHDVDIEEARRVVTESHLDRGWKDVSSYDSTLKDVHSYDSTLGEHVGDAVLRRMAPLTRGNPPSPFTVDFIADDEEHDALVDLRSLQLPVGGVTSVGTSIEDPAIALLLALRAGRLSANDMAHVTEKGAPVTEVSFGEGEIQELLFYCWTGRLDPGGQSFPAQLFNALTGATDPEPPEWVYDHLSRNTPFAWTETGTARIREALAPDDGPQLLVVGDVPEDILFWMLADRVLGTTLFATVDQLRAGDEVGRGVRQAVIWYLTLGLPSHTPIRVTSTTRTLQELETVVQLLSEAGAFDLGDGSSKDVAVISPGSIDWSSPLRLVDQEQWDIQQATPFWNAEAATALPLPVPQGVSCPTREELRWHTDIVTHRPTPSRGVLNSAVLANDEHFQPWGRAGLDGVSVWSRRMGLIPGGAHRDRTRARPRPRAPDALEVFDRLAAPAGLQLSPSDAGVYTRSLLERWVDLRSLADVFRGNVTWGVLHGYVASNGRGRMILKRPWLRLSELAEAADSDTDDVALTETIDRFLERGVLRRGWVLDCGICRWQGAYPIETVDESFTCDRCGIRQVITGQSLPDQGSEPILRYTLDEMTYQAVTKNIRAPVLALDALRREARSFDFAPELAVRKNGKDWCENDLWVIADGRVVLGEATTRNVLHDTPAKEKERLQRIAELSSALTADVVVFATTEETWSKRTTSAAEDAYSNQDTELRWIEKVAEV